MVPRHAPCAFSEEARVLPLTPQNRRDLLAFLQSLTDEEVTRDPRFAAPW
jgi:hypothetical protein